MPEQLMLPIRQSFIPAGCREAHKVPLEECGRCNLDTYDHTVNFLFPIYTGHGMGMAFEKVCLKDYERVVPGTIKRMKLQARY